MSLFFRFRYNLEVSDVQGSDFIILNLSGIEISEETICILHNFTHFEIFIDLFWN